jgi:putative flippase GtrA
MIAAIEPQPSGTPVHAAVEIVVPVYNEEADLEPSIRRLHAYLRERFPLAAIVTIVDNASTDGTWAIAQRLAAELPGVQAKHLDRKGRGRALRAAWSASEADVVAYMDVDLSTDLDALLPLVAPLLSGHSDVAIGSRLAKGARVVRGPKREVISRSYNLILKATLRSRFSDAQCGFKAIRRDVADLLLPLVEDDTWFFDTELLVLAERNGYRIHEVPVDWVDDPDSRVDIVRTATDDLRGVMRMLRRFARGEGRVAGAGRDPFEAQVLRFAGVGVASTVAHVVLFLLLRDPFGVLAANAAALAATTVANLAAHRRITFGTEWHPGRAPLRALGLFAVTLVVTTLTLAVAVLVGGGLVLQLLGLGVGLAISAVIRFVLLRAWVARRHLSRES